MKVKRQDNTTEATRTLRFAITGGIGTGKSYVSHLLNEHFGIPIYNCDAEAKRLNVESDEIRKKLTALIGPEAYAANGSLQKTVIAQYLFANAENAARINAITHPVVAHDFEQWAQRQQDAGKKTIGMECAILFESGFDKLVDVIVNVSAPHQVSLQRATLRDNTNAEAIERRMALQMSSEEREKRSTFTILNDGRPLLPQLESLVEKIERYKKN